MPRRRPIICLLSMLFAAGLTGCAAIPLAMVGTAAGIAGTVVTTGADVYSMGKLDTAEMATADDVRQAADDAGRELHFAAVAAGFGADGNYVTRWRDSKGSETDVTVEPRTPTLTQVRINVGTSGSEPTARLILKRIRHHLPNNAEAKPKDADPSES